MPLDSGDDGPSFSDSVISDCLPLVSPALLRPFPSDLEDVCAVLLMIYYNEAVSDS